MVVRYTFLPHFRSIWAKQIMFSLELGNRFSVDSDSKNNVFVRTRIFGRLFDFRFSNAVSVFRLFVRLFVRSFVFVNVNFNVNVNVNDKIEKCFG